MLECQAIAQKINTVIQKINEIKQQQEEEQARQRALQAARIKEEQNQKRITQFEANVTEVILNNQHDALESVYLTWSSTDLDQRYLERAEALRKDLSQQKDTFTHFQKVLEQEAQDLLHQSAELNEPQTLFYQKQINKAAHLAQEAQEQGRVLFASQLLDWG